MRSDGARAEGVRPAAATNGSVAGGPLGVHVVRRRLSCGHVCLPAPARARHEESETIGSEVTVRKRRAPRDNYKPRDDRRNGVRTGSRSQRGGNAPSPPLHTSSHPLNPSFSVPRGMVGRILCPTRSVYSPRTGPLERSQVKKPHW